MAADLPHLAPNVVNLGTRLIRSSAGEAVTAKQLARTTETRLASMVANEELDWLMVTLRACLYTSVGRSKFAGAADQEIGKCLKNV